MSDELETGASRHVGKHLYGTLGALQDACREHVFQPKIFRDAPTVTVEFAPTGEAVCRAPDERERQFVGLAVVEGVRLLKEEKLPHRHKAMERFFEEGRRRSEQAVTMVCGFGFLITALISWLIGKALDWLWRWYTDTDEAPSLICGMMAMGS